MWNIRFKWKNNTCGHCGIKMGKEVKVLLDDGICPHCDEGKVSLTQPRCTKCGREVNQDFINWG
jgi:uncharacterized protein (DUF983 family)